MIAAFPGRDRARRVFWRSGGAVGGPPAARGNTHFFAASPDIFGPGLWVVGDSVFPGQGTMATVLSAIRVIERITGDSWECLRGRANPPGSRCGHEQRHPLEVGEKML